MINIDEAGKIVCFSTKLKPEKTLSKELKLEPLKILRRRKRVYYFKKIRNFSIKLG